MIKILKNTQELLGYRDEWQKLCQSCNLTYTPFQHFDYVYNSWEYMSSCSGELKVVVIIRQKDLEILAIFPCYIDKKKTLRFINDRHSDFCSAIVRDDYIDDYHLYEEFYEYYRSDKSFKRLQLINLSDSNPMFANLAFFMKGSVNRVVNMYSEFSISLYEDSQTSFVNSLSRLSPKEKYRLKNILKKSAAMTLRIYECKTDKFPEVVVDSLIRRMIRLGMRTADYFNVNMLKLFKSLYEAGVLQVFTTYEKEQPIAANLFLVSQNEFIDWIALYNDKKNNIHNLLQAVEYISHSGGRLNFARGTYEYKMHNFRPALHFLYGIYHSKSVVGKFCNLWSANLYYIRQIAKSIIRK